MQARLPHICRLVGLLVIQINSRCLFLTMGSKLLQVNIGIQLKSVSQVNEYTLSYRFYMEMSMGVSLLRTAQSLLTGRTVFYNTVPQLTPATSEVLKIFEHPCCS